MFYRMHRQFSHASPILEGRLEQLSFAKWMSELHVCIQNHVNVMLRVMLRQCHCTVFVHRTVPSVVF